MITMKCWPVPQSYSQQLPKAGKPGSFWEQRQDRFHCGVDIYAPRKSKILSIFDGIVFDVGIFTHPTQVYYWNMTHYLLIANSDGTYFRYAELEDVTVTKGMTIRAGDQLGSVGQVLNSKKMDSRCPLYIQRLNEKKQTSMLHLEWHDQPPVQSTEYFGGNWFGSRKPPGLQDPTFLLESIPE